MRFPSLDLVVSQTARVARRFPLVTVAALVSAAGCMALIAGGGSSSEVELRIWLIAATAIPALLGPSLWARRGQPVLARGVQVLAVLVLVLFFWQWAGWTQPLRLRHYAQASLAAHLLVAFLPYVGRPELNGFWQYNQRLLLRFLQSAVFSAVLFAGLAVALVAVDKLLGVGVDGDVYGYLAVLIGMVFNTLYFLGGIDEPLENLEFAQDYPKALKIFAQYILTPIVALYLVILTIYLAKVVVTREWPSGWIGYLVSSVSVAGMLSLLLLHPIQHRRENRWVVTYSRWFYVALLPSVAMLLLAIGKRIEQYGVTENRYFMVVLTLWLAGIAVYFITSRSRDIRWIPITLCVVALVTSAGPWSAYAVAKASQSRRLTELFQISGMLDEGNTAPVRVSESSLSWEHRRELSAVLNYLVYTHGIESIEPWFPDLDLEEEDDPLPSGSLHRGQADEVTRRALVSMGVDHVPSWQRSDTEHFSMHAQPGETLEISGFDYAVRLQGMANRAQIFDLGGESITATFDFDQRPPRLVLKKDTEEVAQVHLTDIDSLAQANQRDAQALHFRGEGGGWRLLLVIRSLSGTRGQEPGTLTMNVMDAELLLATPR